MSLLEITGIKLYGYHGCFEEEQVIGQEYEIDVVIELSLEQSALNDDLNETIDYCVVYNIVKAQMAIKSKLIENVAYRIKECIKAYSNRIKSVQVSVKKLSPPVHGHIQYVKVTL